MHDGALAQFSCAVRDVLNNAYHDWWIGGGGTHSMASTLARFEPSGFLLVGTPKNPCACSSCWQWRGTSPSHCGCLSDYLQLPRHLWTDIASTMRHVEACTESQGGHFSTHYLYKYTLSAMTHKLNISTHMLI
jgi:hypothetical protein